MFLIIRTETFAKLFFIVSLTGIFIYAILAFYTFHNANKSHIYMHKLQEKIKKMSDHKIETSKFDLGLKYILLWNFGEPNHIGEGQAPFVKNNCSFANCVILTNKFLIENDYRKFDAVIINVTYLKRWKKMDMPQWRSDDQKYVFYGMMSADDYPVCSPQADNYFNWTWSYKLFSDIFSPFIEVKDLEGNVVAPKHELHRDINDNEELLNTNLPVMKIEYKPKALAWIINKCGTLLNRIAFALQIKREMKKLNLIFDVFGCGNEPVELIKDNIGKNYHFYLVFEDSMSEDYVTSEIMKAYDNYVVPIVISGADLNKFLPPGSYLNARNHSSEKLAASINYILRNPSVYHSFQNWRDYYTIHTVEPNRGICELCKRLNDINLMSIHSHYEMFRKWWNSGPLSDYCFSGAERLSDFTSYMISNATNDTT